MPRVLRALCAMVCLSVVSCLGPVLTASPAAASITVLCKGYDGCKALGMGHAGYKAAGDTMWWRMYAGHNCTNYAAYRMVRSGLPNVRPWTGSGNAMYWGESNPSVTDSVPAVGAVAWWDANIRGASGSAGHVAFVEQVVSADEIVVSQDSWGGDFSWARITRSGGGWPSGFIHFNDAELTNKAVPEVTGTLKVGAVLTATPGTWSRPDVTVSYQWRADGRDIPRATTTTLLLTAEHVGRRISVRTTASKLGYPTVAATGPATRPIQPGQITNTVPPTVTGSATVDHELVASPGQWTPEPTTVSYQWTADGVPVPGATEPVFTPGPAEVGKAMAVVLSASRSGYENVQATSASTPPVAPGTIARTGTVLVAGVPRLGQTLALDAGRFAPGDAQVSIEWRRSGVPVPEVTGTSYPLTAADLGARIAARVRFAKPGYTTVVTRVPSSRIVKTVPAIRANATVDEGRVDLAVIVKAPGVTPVTGTVLIRSGGAVLKQLTLRQGAATATLKGLEPGKRTIRIRYIADETVTGATLVREIRIR